MLNCGRDDPLKFQLCSQGDSHPVRFANIISLISQALVARSEVDDATIGKTVLLDVILHDTVVPVGINTDVCITREAEIHDVAEDSVNIWVTGDSMYDMIRKGII